MNTFSIPGNCHDSIGNGREIFCAIDPKGNIYQVKEVKAGKKGRESFSRVNPITGEDLINKRLFALPEDFVYGDTERFLLLKVLELQYEIKNLQRQVDDMDFHMSNLNP